MTEIHHNASLHIMLVDDDADSRQLVELTLQTFGYRVSSFAKAQEAVKAFCQGIYHLILMDLDMPDMDGLEATRQIRRFERENDKQRVPIIALSGYVEEVERERCKAAGIDDRLAKIAISADSLQKKLEQWLISNQQ